MSKTTDWLAGALIWLLFVALLALAAAAFDSTRELAGKPCKDRGGIPVMGGPNHDELVNCLGIKK